MIEFFPNKMAGSAPMVTYTTDRRMTLEQWLIEQRVLGETGELLPPATGHPLLQVTAR